MVQGINNQSQAHLNLLPTELLLQIGKDLDHSSLLDVLAVSKRMASLADPSLFHDMRISSSQCLHSFLNQIEKLPEELREDVGNAVSVIHASGASLDDNDIAAIKNVFPRLEKLDISSNAKLTSNVGETIGQMTYLKELNASFCDFQPPFAHGLSKSQSLEVINLAMNKLGLDGLKDLTKVGTLQKLDYSSNRIQNFRNEADARNGIENFSSKMTLKILNISANGLTDKSLEPFAQNTSVHFLVSFPSKASEAMSKNISDHFSASNQGRVAAFTAADVNKIRIQMKSENQ